MQEHQEHQEKKSLTLYTNYYYPEVASLAQLCKDLCEGLSDEFNITVICSVPCYTGTVEEKYRKAKYYFETYEEVNVIRVHVPEYDKHNKISRVKNILAYFFRSLRASFKAPKADYVLAESQPPVLGGLLGVLGKWINRIRGKKTKFIYIIQDYNPEQTMVVGFSKNKLILKLMMLFDKFSCKRADKVVVVGRDMIPTMEKRFTKRNGKISKKMPKTVFINNWMDEKEVYPLPKNDERVVAFRRKYGLEDKFVIMYSGNIGLFYDLENIFKVIEKFKDREDIMFPFVGEGTEKDKLVEYVEKHGMKNVIFIPYQAKEELAYSLNSADVCWVVNAEGIKGVSCPSKLYGILATATPIIAVLEEGTEAREVIESTNCGYAVSPKDYDGIEKLIIKFAKISKEDLEAMGVRGYEYMKEHFTRDISIERYREEIKGCG